MEMPIAHAAPTSGPIIALVAGEASGDQLGAALVDGLRQLHPAARFVGVGGKRMHAAGVDCWWDAQELAVMGLFEVLAHFPRLLRLRRELKRRLLELRPDVFIGIDAPDFNLGLEIQLRHAGLRTVHYVSPTVWAWRSWRVRKIGRAADLVLCLFPFEPQFYEGHGVPARYVGHPLADQIESEPDSAAARAALGLDPAVASVALLPGSRVSEVSLLAEPMIEMARLLRRDFPALQFVCAAANERVEQVFRDALAQAGVDFVRIVSEQARVVIAAADAVVCAAGTATLETMLVNRPLVVVYRLVRSTYVLARYLRLIPPQFFALPNILAGEELVPELIQHDANPERMAREIRRWLEQPAQRAGLQARFDEMHAGLRCDAGRQAAVGVSELLGHATP